jgi:hypothetical protein
MQGRVAPTQRMALTIRPADHATDREALLEVLQRNLTDLPHARRFEWLYLDNPAGQAWSWFLSDGRGLPPVGMASVFPRFVRVGGEVQRCGQVGDFAIDATHRSLGPAVLLQRATFGPVDKGSLAFCYDCPPHDRGMATFRRLGMAPNCEVARYARPLRFDRLLRNRLGAGPLTAALASLSAAVMEATHRRRRGNLDIGTHQGAFTDEFTQLDDHVGADGVVRGRRHAADLDWRYRQDPLNQYVVLTARRAGELAGFAVILLADEDAFLVDLLAETSDVSLDLVDAAAQLARHDSAAQMLYALTPRGSRLHQILQRSRFRYRSPAARVVAYFRLGSDAAGAPASTTWDLVHADVVV